jgi:gliding motility associated protien GldN
MKSLFISVVGVFLLGNTAFCQIEEINGGPVNVPTEGIIDGVYIQEHIPTKRMIPYANVREADAIWSRRVWEYIDLREKINHPLYYPLDEITPYAWVRNASRWSLWTVIRQHVLNGDLRVFSPYNPISYGLGAIDGDQLKYPIDPQPGLNFYTDSAFREDLLYYIGRLGAQSDVPLVDEYGDNIVIINADGTQEFSYEAPDTVWFDSKDIVQYRMKEDWFLDKQRSVLDVRIIALAPVVYKTEEDANGNTSISGTRELFWLYFPHCRFVFNNYFVYNDKNDSQWMSYDDLFWKRRFNSVIYKESNVYDREIESYRTGLDALHESDDIKNEIRNIEHDIWSF